MTTRRGEAVARWWRAASASASASASAVRARASVELATTGEGDGVTLRAASAIDAGTRVVTTPFESWATRSSDFATRAAGRALDGFDANVKPTLALALHVLNERRQTTGDETLYAATMPSDIDLVDSWDAARLATLRGTSTLQSATNRRRFIEGVRATLAVTSSFDVSVRDLSWALSMISSRAVRSDIVPYAFVPGCDLLDHAREPNCALRRDDSNGDVYCVALRDISGGETLTLSYGALTNDRALRMYGFTIDGNPNDARVMANGAWTATRQPSATVPENALDILHAERASLELDDAAKILLETTHAAWARHVKTLRRGQLDILDAQERVLS